ncbi:MAG: putative fortimicin production protein [Candidatus Roizmanbacteria bacterium GW2011_GWB1_40_7]|uniref:Putative fortimicin production protein n=1 Tax=Candidatus Roizmanbacteria bacterium GW2011_GWB1_40_7 TaxID=1618482 RepID=A0A0G0W9T8_9BACT|nr:MAG: putative fortimicin production protein [Candidatus Roizmanbacteria bacterium GW2011_GWB1_40_7]
MKPTYFRSRGKKIPLPVFFPDATRAIIRTIDSRDIESTKTPGILVNTYHLYKDLGKNVLKSHDGIHEFMSWYGGVISDSGGFQVMSIIKRNAGNGKVTDEGVTFHESSKKKVLLTPEISISFQMLLKPDMVVVLDDFTAPGASKKNAEETVERTLSWAKRSKDEFEKICKTQGLSGDKKPYLLGVVQGGEYLDLREYCTKELVKIGFDGLGYGGWPIREDKTFNYGWHIFDCVLPTRDARHKRLYVYNADSIVKIDVRQEKFYSYYVPTKERYYHDTQPVSTACDCLLCTNYSRSYLAHLYRIEESTALRLSTIHNLRFYSILMEKLRLRGKL